jgi:hypothetical protein
MEWTLKGESGDSCTENSDRQVIPRAYDRKLNLGENTVLRAVLAVENEANRGG